MTNEIKELAIVKLSIIIFSIILIIAAGFAVYFTMVKQNSPDQQGNVTIIVIDWHYPELEELAESSDLIVVATVADKLTVWDTADGKKPPRWNISNTLIYTCYFFEVSEETEILKGDTLDDTTEIWGRVLGGTIDGYTLDAREVPKPEIGETVLLFLKTNIDDNDSGNGSDNGNGNDSGNGKLIPWYHVGMPNLFYETESGTFVNSYYGEITIEEVTALSHSE